MHRQILSNYRRSDLKDIKEPVDIGQFVGRAVRLIESDCVCNQ